MLCLETTGSLFRKLWSSGEGRVTVTGWAGLVRYHSLTLADHRLLQARVFWVPHRLSGAGVAAGVDSVVVLLCSGTHGGVIGGLLLCVLVSLGELLLRVLCGLLGHVASDGLVHLGNLRLAGILVSVVLGDLSLAGSHVSVGHGDLRLAGGHVSVGHGDLSQAGVIVEGFAGLAAYAETH